MSEPVPVPVGACRCPGSPHDEDTVYLAGELGLTAGLAVEAAMFGNKEEQQTLAVSLALIRHNIVGWTFTDEQGQAVPVSPDSIERLLPYSKGGEAVASKAASLYMDEWLLPLQARRRKGSPPSSTNGQTRPILASHEPSRKRRSGSSSRAASAGGR